ncbi:MAG: MFS transporter [Alphaproteobacteria bacterium]|nr:MFS transporter [Alphaproteobacteria bacterium]
MTQSGAAAAGVDSAARRYTLFLLVVVYTSSFIDRSVLNILIQPIKNEFHASDSAMGFLSGFAFAFLYAALGIPVARWADRANRRNIIAAAIAVWSGMTALCGAAQSFWQLALARVGVGIGEAGSGPPSQSVIADLYPPEQRTSAMAIYSWGIHIGLMFGALAGGWIAQYWGWRNAFLVVGLPGLLVAALVRFTMREPPRTASVAARSGPGDIPVLEVFAYLWRVRSLRHVIIGCTLVAIVGYGTSTWSAPYLIRSHGLSVGQAATYLGLLGGVAGIVGSLGAGLAADRLGARDPRWIGWVVALAKLLVVPFVLLFYLAPSLGLTLVGMVFMIGLAATYQGSTFAMLQTLSPLRMRAQASAIMLFASNLIGMGLGPSIVGMISDGLHPWLGVEALRYAVPITSLFGLWGAWHYYLAGKHYREDLEIAEGRVAA